MRPRNPNPKGPQGHPGAGKWAEVQDPAEWEGNFRFEGTRGPPWWAGCSHRASGGSGGAARRSAPARAGAGWGEDDLGRGIETQGRSESRPSRKARRGFGTRRRSKASRPSESRRTSRERGLATVHGAGEVENAPLPGRDCRASGSEVRGFAGSRFRAALLSQGSRAQPLRRQEHLERRPGPSYGAQAQVEGGGGCGGPGNRPEHPHSRRDVVAGLPFTAGVALSVRSPGRQLRKRRTEVDPRAPGGRSSRERTGSLARCSSHLCRPGETAWRSNGEGAKGRGDAVPAAGEDRLRRESALRGRSRFTRTAHRAIGVQRGGVESETQ